LRPEQADALRGKLGIAVQSCGATMRAAVLNAQHGVSGIMLLTLLSGGAYGNESGSRSSAASRTV
jgi:hypothetical protein